MAMLNLYSGKNLWSFAFPEYLDLLALYSNFIEMPWKGLSCLNSVTEPPLIMLIAYNIFNFVIGQF